MSIEPTPSWDAERGHAPERPRFASSLPPEELIPRPRRMLVALAVLGLAAAAWAAIVALAAIDLDALRQSLVEALPSDLRADYAQAEQETAASVMLAVAGAIGTLPLVVQLLAMRSIVVDRSPVARIVAVVATLVQVAATLFATLLVGDDAATLVLAGATIACALVAVGLVLTPRASRWLRQGEEPRTIPIASAAG